MFPFLGILQHYAKFNTCTIVMLEKLLGVGSFGGSISHLTHCQGTFFASSGKFNLLSMV
jgi:hypothetical protein